MTLQNVNKSTIEDLVDSERDESLIPEVKKMIRMFKELKVDIQNN
jgi:hypothetical protein